MNALANIIQINGKNVKDSTAARMASLAPVEASTTATAAHAAGALFWLDGTLYEATAAIAVGGTITVGTNCKVVDINNMAQPDWNQPNTTARDYIKNKPAIRQQANGGGILENGATSASGPYSHAEGGGTSSTGDCSHAEGSGATASGYASHAEGGGTQASIEAAHAEGSGTTASGHSAHSEGGGTTASGQTSHAEGGSTTASGRSSHAEGGGTIASGDYSHAEGSYTTANHMAQHVFGIHNVPDGSTESAGARGNYVEIVGNGLDVNRRSNARTLDWSGNESLAGGITLGMGTADEVTLSAAQLKQLLALLN